jgi:hypothetical protein
MTCSIQGCDKPHYAFGWCQMHYRRWKNHGDPAVVLSRSGRRRDLSPPVCAIMGCEELVGLKGAKGLCVRHYDFARRNGVPEPRHRPSATERFWSRVSKTDECWFWMGTLNPAGYGVFNLGNRAGNKTVLAHRFAYEQVAGPILEESLDHLCYVRRCVNPAHMEPVPLAENQRRARERRSAGTVY